MRARRLLLEAAAALADSCTDLAELTEAALHRLLCEAGSDERARLYEALAGVRLERSGGQLRAVVQRGTHRATGRYYTAEPLVQHILNQILPHLPDQPKVLDPAAGGGAFLAALERKAEAWGADIDEQALSLCRQAAPSAHLVRADALLEPLPGPFDAVVGNPPYIASGLRGAAALPPDRQAVLKERYPDAARYKLNTYPLFIERALGLLRDGGWLGFVVPDSLLSGRYFGQLRRLLLTRTTLWELNLIREDFWTHGRVGQTLVLILQKLPPPSGHRVRVRLCDRLTDLSSPPVLIPQGGLGWGAASRWRFAVTPGEDELIRLVEACPDSLGLQVTPYSGLIGRQGQRSLIAPDGGGSGATGRLLRSGREIDRYSVRWSGHHVRLDPDLIKSGGKLEHYRQAKLLLRQTADRIRAVYDEEGYFCLNNIHLIVSRRSDVDLQYLLAVLNSSTLDRYYGVLTRETGRLYPQIDLDLLGELPVPAIRGSRASRLASLARRRQKATAREAVALDGEIDEAVEALYRCFVR